MLKRLISLAIASCAAVMAVTAQQVAWSLDYSTVLNNREGGDEMTPDQTFFFARVTPLVGVDLMQGAHKLRGGISWYQPINEQWDGYKIHPVLYYTFTHGNWNASLGAMPRTMLRERMPYYLWSDSLSYVQPTVRGALVQLDAGRDYWQMAVDWRQMQSTRVREAFNAFTSGKWHPAGKAVWLGGYLQYNHLAKRKNAPDGEGVNDDMTVNPLVGLDLSHRTALDSLELSAGALLQLQRARIAGGWHRPCAFVARATAQWKWLGLSENVKVGGGDLFPLYNNFGSELNLGDPYYRYKFYSRTDVWARIVSTRFADMRCTLTFHATDRTFGFWQQLSVRFFLDSKLWSRRHDGKWLASGHLGNVY